mmetsp:Transcript_10569/g.22383  ORF Transcript_10569/g.22383 Transcript_10569/m.22383 type:complete len:223 (+) Transcript_10569:260-928(+)
MRPTQTNTVLVQMRSTWVQLMMLLLLLRTAFDSSFRLALLLFTFPLQPAFLIRAVRQINTAHTHRAVVPGDSAVNRNSRSCKGRNAIAATARGGSCSASRAEINVRIERMVVVYKEQVRVFEKEPLESAKPFLQHRAPILPSKRGPQVLPDLANQQTPVLRKHLREKRKKPKLGHLAVHNEPHVLQIIPQRRRVRRERIVSGEQLQRSRRREKMHRARNRWR